MESFNRLGFDSLKASGSTFMQLRDYKPSFSPNCCSDFILSDVFLNSLSSQCHFVVLHPVHAMPHRRSMQILPEGQANFPGKFETARWPLTSFTNNNETGNNKA